MLAREQHLSALDGLAAAAAHELGTPLSTVVLVVRELERALPKDGPHADDIKLLREQTERCRSILATLTTLGSGDAPFDRMPLSLLMEEVAAPHRPFGVEITLDLPLERADEPVIARNPGIIYGLGNFVENAVDFARSQVAVSARWDADTIAIEISDDGPGFSPAVIDRIGEPYVTVRGSRRDRAAVDGPGGLGLGFFIAKNSSGADRREARCRQSSGSGLGCRRARELAAPRARTGRGCFFCAACSLKRGDCRSSPAASCDVSNSRSGCFSGLAARCGAANQDLVRKVGIIVGTG